MKAKLIIIDPDKIHDGVYSEIVPEYIGHEEGVQFDIMDECAVLSFNYYNPTIEEILECQFAENIEIRTLELKDTLLVLFKIGDLNWIESPYNIHLSCHWENKDSYKDMKELPLLFKMVDCNTGTVSLLRLITLDGAIITQIKKAIEQQLKQPFEQEKYDAYITELFKKYTTKQMIKMSTCGFKSHKNN